MTDMSNREQHGLEMGVYVDARHRGEGIFGVVAEEQLEVHGWGTDPLAAVAKYRASLGIPDDVELRVCTDEESHYPTYTYVLSAEIGIRSTRPQRVLRELAAYFMNLANGIDSNPGFSGKYELNRLDDTREEN
jgi:hypothetical protein